ncbi:sodium channel protein type 8 subunit alpha [Striga asiatica]|uniref:Sodium channel protein type 8 subunit alpha n=1 Tax=Striga asiatica TaxID=4170 RepID=A0A5A7R590_STRAF|nr:sodium channel protein type 8 subunit alpha [Striga asiatica]
MNPTEPRPISGEPFSAVQAAKSSESSRPGPTTEFRFSGEHLLSAAETSLRMRADNHHRQRDRETHPRPLCHLKTSRSKPCHLRELSHSRGEPRQTRTGLAVTENPFFPFHRERVKVPYLKP